MYLNDVFNIDKKNTICVISLSTMFVYCCDLDEDQIKFYDQFMQNPGNSKGFTYFFLPLYICPPVDIGDKLNVTFV